MPASLSLIWAMDENRLIGRNNALPWHLPADLAYFKKITLGKPIIMGRKTYESIGRPLPGRRNMVISRSEDLKIEGCDVCTSVEQALQTVENEPEAMLIGGASLYQQTLNLAQTLYVTQIHHKFTGDTYFPVVDEGIWHEVWSEDHQADSVNPYPYSFIKFLRK
jgi:dihydrofolate reductase